MHIELRKQQTLLPVVCGFAAGLINGLLGAGGGIVLVFAIRYLGRNLLTDARDVYANALIVSFVLTLVSTALYTAGGNAPTTELGMLALPATLGGLAGGLLLGRFSTHTVRILFALLLVISGAMMILR